MKPKETSTTSSLVLDPSLDDRTAEQTDKPGRKKDREKRKEDGLMGKGPKDRDDGSTCPIQDAVALLGGPSSTLVT